MNCDAGIISICNVVICFMLIYERRDARAKLDKGGG